MTIFSLATNIYLYIKNIGITPFLSSVIPMSIVASVATIVSCLKTRKKEDSPKTPNQHNES